MSFNSTSAYWSMMQKVDHGEFSVTFTKIQRPSPFIYTLSCGETFPPQIWNTMNVCGRTVGFNTFTPKKGYCVKCGKKVDAFCCNDCMVGANK